MGDNKGIATLDLQKWSPQFSKPLDFLIIAITVKFS